MFDRRVYHRNIRKGIITRDDYLGYLSKLDDVTDNIAEDDEEDELNQPKTVAEADTAEVGTAEIDTTEVDAILVGAAETGDAESDATVAERGEP